jgi:TonB-dependent receptor
VNVHFQTCERSQLALCETSTVGKIPRIFIREDQLIRNFITGKLSSSRALALTTASSIALCAFIASPVYAQETGTAEVKPDNAEQEDIIIVTGYRKALENAQTLKRKSDTFVDVITSEDIGALPDRSLAEALQRVPGVNISRFAQRDDPDRFSVEGSGVVIRGLPYVASHLNGRDIFSANGGRELSFNDVSPELVGRVEIFKNTTADIIEGQIAGSVNLVTRKPLNRRGLHLAGAVEGNYGDLAKEWSPGFSILGSNTFETPIGTFGVQLSYTQSELVTRTDASQITDPCYRDKSLTGACFRVRPVGSGGFSGTPLNASNFPPANAVLVPKGAGVRTTDLTRDRDAISAVGQWESNDGNAQLTVEYLRAKTKGSLNEFAILALVNDDGLFPTIAPGTTATFNGNQFATGTLTQFQPFNGGRGIPTELLRFQSADSTRTEDLSAQLKLKPTDRLSFNFEVQNIKSNRNQDGFISAMQTYSDLAIDNTGDTPQVQFLQPGGATSPTSYFNDPSKTFYWFLLDNQSKNDGDLTSMRFDADYDVSEEGFIKKARFGARWSDRNRVTRSANFSNWGNLGAPWTGRGGNWNCGDFQAFGCGGAYVRDFPASAQLRNPFGDNFQRGTAPVPLGDGSAFFFGGDNVLGDYLSGAVTRQAAAITAYTLTPNAWFPISARNNTLPGGPWTPGEISDVDESTFGSYARIDFGTKFSDTVTLNGNIGLRYVETTVRAAGSIAYPTGQFFDALPNGNGNNVVSVAEVQAACARTQPGQQAPAYCSLSAARLAQFASVFTGEVVDDSAKIKYEHWLPSFNANVDFGNGMLIRAAASKGISRPDLAAYATGGAISDNTANLRAGGTLATGPLFQIGTGNRLLRPLQAWNYDLSFEYYFDRVGSITVSAFMKNVTGIVNGGANVRSFTSPSGVTTDVLVNGPVNSDSAKLKGIEVAYQQTYDFLPGLLSGFGTQLTYTYVDAGSFGNASLGSEQSPFAAGLPLAGVSKHTINAVAFYEKGPLSARAAYNWRSEFLQTPRDVIFPFSPIYGEATGQLDGSIFFAVNKRLKLGVQGVNLLDSVTRTSQVIDFVGTRATRSAFRNDRRYTFLARFDF